MAVKRCNAVSNKTTSDTRYHAYMCDYRQGLDWWMDLLTTYTHCLWLHSIIAPPLISTVHKSPQHPLSLFCSLLCFHQLSHLNDRKLDHHQA
jgi:thiaminase